MSRVVVVTGAASGIGFATAERFRDLGDTVFGLDIAPTVPDGVTYVECNVGSKAAVDAAIAVCAEGGRIDVLANVAGVVQFGRFETVTEEVFDRTLDIDRGREHPEPDLGVAVARLGGHLGVGVPGLRGAQRGLLAPHP